MTFKINLTKAQMMWRMQEFKRPAEVYLSMEGKVSKQYCFMVIRELFELGYVERRQGIGRNVLYKSTELGLSKATDKLKESSSTE